MTKEQIDQLIVVIENDYGSQFINFITDNNLRQMWTDMWQSYINGEEVSNKKIAEAFRNVMHQIEDEGYEYFCEQCTSHYTCRSLLIGADDKHKKEFLEGKVKGVELANYEILDIIESLEDEEYKKACIEGKVEGIELDSHEKSRIIESLEDEEYKKACIEGKVEGIELDSYSRSRIIGSLEDEEYKKACIEGKAERVKLNSCDKLELIEKMEEEYKKACIEGKIKLTNNEILSIIATIKDEDYILNYINNPEPPIDASTRESIIGVRVIRKVNDINIDINFNFSLPEEMTVGIEIENEGEMSDIIKKQFSFGTWKAKGDSSLVDGVEIVSPILHPTQEDAQAIYKVTGMLNQLGQNVSERCGGHIHIGANYLTSVQAYKNLMEIWGNTEEILYTISNESGSAPRSGMSQYATPITAKLQDAINSGKIELTDEKDLDDFVEELKEVQGERYSGLNLLNINNGKNTIEFRLANGTINPDLWLDNINLFGGIVSVAQELTVSQDKRKQELFSRLTEDISNEEKLPILLELVGVAPERYVERYSANIELMKGAEHAFSGIQGPTKFTPKKIKDMTKDVPALDQYEAIQGIVKEMEHQQEQQKDNAKGIGL